MNLDGLHDQIEAQKRELDLARYSGDELRIELAEASLNQLLDQVPHLSHVTTEEHHSE